MSNAPKKRAATPDDDSHVDLTGDSSNDEKSPSVSARKPAKQAKRAPLRSVECGIVSYNIWFDQRHQARRMEAVGQAILTDPPHLVGLQEVTAPLAITLFPILESVGYQIIQQDEIQGFYGCAMAMNVDTVKSSGFQAFPNSMQARGLLWAVVEIDGLELLFATTHLESFVPGNPGASQREEQAVFWTSFAEQKFRSLPNLSGAVLVGDLNWDDERPRSKGQNRPLLSLIGEDKWTDAWKDHNPHDEGYTYDGRLNPMIGGIRRRLDRCLIRGNTPVTVEEAELIGRGVIPGLEYNGKPVLPSDHFGLRVQMRFRTSNDVIKR